MQPVTQLALAILQARAELPRKLQELVTPEVAWALAVVLISWRPEGHGGEVDLRDFKDVTDAFDRFADTLLRFRQYAARAKSTLELAGASGIFLSAVNLIGATLLIYLLQSDRFQSLKRYIEQARPIPKEVQRAGGSAAEGERSTRNDRYRQFDNRPRAADAPQEAAPTAAQLAQWWAELDRPDLSPEMRWFYEQKLESANLAAYRDLDHAERMWAATLRQPALNPALRDYFAANLDAARQVRNRA